VSRYLDWLGRAGRSDGPNLGTVDFAGGIVRLERDTTTSGEGRTFRFTALPQLAALLQRQREHTSQMERRLGQVIPHVFHRNGKPIKTYNGAWRSACKWAAIVKRDGLDCHSTAAARSHPSRLENRLNVPALCDRGRPRPSDCGGIAGEGDNRGTIAH
jgi:hypothetical protein